MMEKKGALTSSQLIGLIILVISFVVVLLLWAAINWIPIIDKETCHQSIIFRGSFNVGPIQTSEIVPLKCQTEKICLTHDENCQQFPPPKRGSGVTKVKISKNDADAREEVMETIANAMFDCHSTLGEGKVLFFPNRFYKGTYCLVCSRIVFEKDTLKEISDEEFKDIGYGEFYRYLQSKKTIDGRSYLEFLHPNWVDWRAIQPAFFALRDSEEAPESLKAIDFNDWVIDKDYEEGYAIISTIITKSTGEAWLKAVGVAAIPVGATLIASGIGAPVGMGLIALSVAGGTVAGGVTFFYNHPSGDAQYSPPAIYPYNAESLNSLGCTSFETAP